MAVGYEEVKGRRRDGKGKDPLVFATAAVLVMERAWSETGSPVDVGLAAVQLERQEAPRGRDKRARRDGKCKGSTWTSICSWRGYGNGLFEVWQPTGICRNSCQVVDRRASRGQ